MFQLFRHEFPGGTCEQKCLVSHLQVTFGEEACRFLYGSDKTWNPHSETVSWCGVFSQGLWEGGQSCQIIPLMSLWQEKGHTQSHKRCTDVTLLLQHGITAYVSCHHGWPHTEPFKPPGQTVAESEPCGKYSRPHSSNWEWSTQAFRHLTIYSETTVPVRWRSFGPDKPTVTKKWRKKVSLAFLALVSI